MRVRVSLFVLVAVVGVLVSVLTGQSAFAASPSGCKVVIAEGRYNTGPFGAMNFKVQTCGRGVDVIVGEPRSDGFALKGRTSRGGLTAYRLGRKLSVGETAVQVIKIVDRTTGRIIRKERRYWRNGWSSTFTMPQGVQVHCQYRASLTVELRGGRTKFLTPSGNGDLVLSVLRPNGRIIERLVPLTIGDHEDGSSSLVWAFKLAAGSRVVNTVTAAAWRGQTPQFVSRGIC